MPTRTHPETAVTQATSLPKAVGDSIAHDLHETPAGTFLSIHRGEAPIFTFMGPACRDALRAWQHRHDRITPRREQATLREAVANYFAGRGEAFSGMNATLPPGTPFQQAVWKALRELPFGTVCTYGELARQIGRPAAVRAVGQALHVNPLMLLIPCHRVVGSSRHLTGFGCGLSVKQKLLIHEGWQVDAANRLSLSGRDR